MHRKKEKPVKNGSELGKRTHFAERQKPLPNAMPARPSPPKGDKIKRDTMISDYEQGGLKMVDVKIFSKALKATWIKKYLDQNNQAKWKLFFDLQLQDLGGATFFRGNLNQKDLEKKKSWKSIGRFPARNTTNLVRSYF